MKQILIAAAALALLAAPASAQQPQPVFNPAASIGSFLGAVAFGTGTMLQGAVTVATSPFELVRPVYAAEPVPPAPERRRHRAR